MFKKPALFLPICMKKRHTKKEKITWVFPSLFPAAWLLLAASCWQTSASVALALIPPCGISPHCEAAALSAVNVHALAQPTRESNLLFHVLLHTGWFSVVNNTPDFSKNCKQCFCLLSFLLFHRHNGLYLQHTDLWSSKDLFNMFDLVYMDGCSSTNYTFKTSIT